MKKIFVAGGVSYDQIIYLENLPDGKPGAVFSHRAHKSIGGTGAGKSLNLSRLGFNVIFHAFVGEDYEGEQIKKYIGGTKINFIPETDKQGTQQYTNLIDKDGNRISIFTAYNTFEPVYDRKKLDKIIRDADYVVLNIMNYARFLIEDAKLYKKEIWCDIHDYDGKNSYHNDFIDGADYIFMSSEVIEDYKGYMSKLISEGKKLVVCTHGKKGASVMTASGEYYEEGIIDSYEKVDVNGAGDSFFAGFLYAFSQGYDIVKCMKMGTINGGLCITSNELYYKALSPEILESEYKKYYQK